MANPPAFDVRQYILPQDEDGNEIQDPLLWMLPPPCQLQSLVPETRGRFSRLIKRIIEARLEKDGHSIKVVKVMVVRPLAVCKVLTAHEILVHFSVDPEYNLETDGPAVRKDIAAAVPLGVRKVLVKEDNEDLPLYASGPLARVVPTVYTVHCIHNKRTSGHIPFPPASDYVQIKNN